MVMKILIPICFLKIESGQITRGHDFMLLKEQLRWDVAVRNYSFSQKTINVWNTLSGDCVHASSVNMFKNRIDKYLVEHLPTFRIIICRFSISQWPRCLLPTELFLGW